MGVPPSHYLYFQLGLLLGYENFISAMNTHASAIADSVAWWSQSGEVAFCKLVKSIKKATDHDLQRFDDSDQDSRPLGLFKIFDC